MLITIAGLNPRNDDQFYLMIEPTTGGWGAFDGGGGYGNALERDPEAVLEDVLDKYVSSDQARSTYGVVLTADMQVNQEKTQALRASLAAI